MRAMPLPGLFMIIFLSLAVVASFFAMVEGRRAMESPQAGHLINGGWASAYEKVFDKSLLIRNPSKNFWGLLDYAAFREGREGVLIGDDGWLFTAEEFEYFPDSAQAIQSKLDFIAAVKDEFESRHIRLVIALLPAKARLYQENLGRYRYPPYKKNTYRSVIDSLRKGNIVAPDLYDIFKKHETEGDLLFLHTDTHWTPDGARLTAQAVAAQTARSFSDLSLDRKRFKTTDGGTQRHMGDLMRYVSLGPLTGKMGPAADILPLYKTTPLRETVEASSLFGDVSIPVTLVGTSYSANPFWNFDGFLKEALQADVLNAADEGMGPFATMENYLQDRALETSPPQLVVWEIPERYLDMPYDFGPR